MLALNFNTFGKIYANNGANEKTYSGDTSTAGWFVNNRTGASAISLLKNGTVIDTDTDTATGLPSLDMYVLAWNNVGSVGNYSDNQVSLMIIGGGANQTTLNAAVQTLKTAIGF
jgi:hypothetical protein